MSKLNVDAARLLAEAAVPGRTIEGPGTRSSSLNSFVRLGMTTPIIHLASLGWTLTMESLTRAERVGRVRVSVGRIKGQVAQVSRARPLQSPLT